MLLALLLALGPAAAPAVPARVVSFNLCADLLLLSLLPRERIVSLGPYAGDPSMSPLAARAAGITVNHGRVEEIVAFAPDLVLAGRFNSPETLALLRRLGLPLLLLDVPSSLEETRTQVRQVAAAVGAEAAGEALVADMDARLQSAAAGVAEQGKRPLAVVYRANGFTAGANTLVDDVLAAAGFDNLATQVGVRGWGTLDLETLLLGEPELLVLDVGDEHPSLATASLRHPALSRLRQSVTVVEVPARLWACAGPWTLGVVERLVAARRSLVRP